MTSGTAPSERGALSAILSHPQQKMDSTWHLLSLPNPSWEYVIGGVEVTCLCLSYKGVWKSKYMNSGFYLREADL